VLRAGRRGRRLHRGDDHEDDDGDHREDDDADTALPCPPHAALVLLVTLTFLTCEFANLLLPLLLRRSGLGGIVGLFAHGSSWSSAGGCHSNNTSGGYVSHVRVLKTADAARQSRAASVVIVRRRATSRPRSPLASGQAFPSTT